MIWDTLETFYLSQRSADTRRNYRNKFCLFCAFLKIETGTDEGAGKIAALKRFDALRYMAYLQGKPGHKSRVTGQREPLAPGTIRVYLYTLRSIFNGLVDEGLIDSNPFRISDCDKFSCAPTKRPAELVSNDKIKALVQAPSQFHPAGVQERAMLSVNYGGALRVSELVGLQVGDVKITEKGTTYLYLRQTKAGAPAVQAIPDWCAVELRRHLLKRVGALPGAPLFEHDGKRYGHHRYRRRFNYWCAEVGLPPTITPHALRATAITRLLSNGVGHREVQEFSRHNSVQMVERYDKRRFAIDDNAAKLLDLGNDEK